MLCDLKALAGQVATIPKLLTLGISLMVMFTVSSLQGFGPMSLLLEDKPDSLSGIAQVFFHVPAERVAGVSVPVVLDTIAFYSPTIAAVIFSSSSSICERVSASISPHLLTPYTCRHFHRLQI